MRKFLTIAAVLLLIILFLSAGVTKAADVTYTKNAQPIIQIHCSLCHNENWPDKNWMDYETAKKNADKIKLRVNNDSMPPGNGTGMTKEERKVISDWVDGGAKK